MFELTRVAMRAKRLLLPLCICVCVVGCASSAPEPPPATIVVVGIDSEPLTGAIDTLHIVTSVAGVTATDETLPIGAEPADLPHEIKLVAGQRDTTAAIGVRVEGSLSAAGTMPLLVRTAEGAFVPRQTMLLRVLLQGQCLMALPGGPPAAPTCTVSQTCIGGICADDRVSPLETYSANWASSTPDICRPQDAGAPIVQVGTGQSDFLPLVDGQMVTAEQGPQGGHHIWIAVRQRNLRQAGSVATITSVQPTTGLAGPKTSFVFTFDADEGGFCKLVGLRYQLDADGVDYHKFLGAPLDVTVVVADATGAKGTGVAHIQVAPTVLCPQGTLGC